MHVLLLSVLITVSAQGRATAAPDMATETFTIATNAATAAAAAADNNTRFERLNAGLSSIGIPKSAVQTVSYSISYTPPANMPSAPLSPGQVVQPQPSGYFVNRSVQVTLTQLGKVGQSIDTAVAAGVTDVGGVTFGMRNSGKQYTQALRSAVQAARVQAEAMAGAAGLHIVGIKTMQEGFVESPVPRMMMAAAVPMAAPKTTIEPSPVEVTANVTLAYEAR